MVANFISTQGDVPIAYTFSIPEFDWFYIPITGILLLGIVGVGIVATTMTIGKRVSGVPGSLGSSIIWYVLLYSFISPFWLLRSTRDVVFSINRSWR